MYEVVSATLGEAWVGLVGLTLQAGQPLGDEGLEILGVAVGFPAAAGPDPLLEQFGDRQMIADMHKVFFSGETNGLGHSYAKLLTGPGGRNDLQDVIALLREDQRTKRAVASLCGSGNGKVPCINTIQFLVRAGAVQAIYFARGQDAYKKFYADALCLCAMTRKVAAALGLPAGQVSGFIASSHIYYPDLPAIREFLAGAMPVAGAVVAGGR